MKPSTPEERELATAQVAAYATRAGTPAWAQSVAGSLHDGDLDRWAREVLRALGWPPALPGLRVYRRPQEDPRRPDPDVPFLPRGPDEHKLAQLYEVEAAAAPEAAYGVQVAADDPDRHAGRVIEWCVYHEVDSVPPPPYFVVEVHNPNARRAGA